MHKDCKCQYCSKNVDAQFCITCAYNFNECESFYEAIEKNSGDLPKFGHPLCPKCCPENWNPETYPGFEIKRKMNHWEIPKG